MNKIFFSFPVLLLLVMIVSNTLSAQIVSNDACLDAYDFGSMTNGVQECYNADNIGANGELPYINQGYCYGVGDVPVPAADVWFQFTAAGNLLDVTITSELDTIMIALYEGDCGALIGRKCAVANGMGFISTSLSPVAIGSNYYLQLSGGSMSDMGDYNICITSYQVQTNICIIDQTISLDPLPYLGTYQAGQMVHICLTIGGYFQNSADWFDGLVPVFGNGWDLNTLQVYPPPTCDGSGGTWGWYDEVIGTGNNSPGVVGPGFFFDRNNDGNPGNDYGDNSSGDDCDWQFCMDIAVNECPPGNNADDLSIEFENYSDSEAGSWSATGSPCLNDPNFVMKALLTCCPIPTMTGIAPTCVNSQSGTVTATSDSETPITFVWSNGVTDISSSGISTINGLGVGFYSVTATDNNDCVQYASIELENPDIPFLAIDYIQPSTCGSGNGSTNIQGYNGQSPYSFTLTNNENGQSTTQNSGNFVALQGGNYTVVVTDAGGCTNSIGVEVAAFETLQASTVVTNTSCPGSTDGQIQVQITGESFPPYTYGLNGGAMQTGNTFGNLAEGEYTIEVADNPITNCHIFITATVGNNGAPSSTATVLNNESCIGAANGSAQLHINNGLPPYTYSINGGTQSDSTFVGLPAATYTYQITDVNGCSTSGTFTIGLDPALTTTTVTTDVTCFGDTNGNVQIGVSGGTAPYQYALNGDSLQAVSQFDSLTPAAYTYQVSDANNCSATGTFTIDEPAQLIIEAGEDRELIIGGSVNIAAQTVSGTPVQYQWSPATGLSCTDCSTPTASPVQNVTYTLQATDANGCTSVDSLHIVVTEATILLVPSAFSPNEDGMNDILRPVTKNIVSYQFRIYNRWGLKLYEGTEADAGWNGKNNGNYVEIGVYVYVVEAIDLQGKEVLKKGNVTLVK